ncbi:MAG: glycosyltransferase family 2 protein [Myxococcales bacterium]|nr:glycosyltransferase family 2 protein [Myxococcales bacterium]
MLLSVVIVNWNGRDYLDACLRSLAAQTHTELEIVVVDNGSEDGSLELLRTHYPRVAVVDAGENLGFAEGCNRGIEQCHGTWVCMLNNDTEADLRWAEALVHAAEAAHAHCGMLQSRMLFMDRPAINSTGIVLKRDGGGIDRGEGEAVDARNTMDAIFCPTAGAAAYRRVMLEAIRLSDGYFDRRHFMYFEDMDLGWRGQLAGWSATYVPESMVRHHYHATSDRHGKAWLARMATTNRMRTLLKNASWPFIVRSSPKTIVEAVRLGWSGGLPALRDYVGAIADSLRSRVEVERVRSEQRRSIERHWAR